MNFRDLIKEKYGDVPVSLLAVSSFMSRQQVYNYISGKVNPEKVSFWSVWNLSEILGVSPLAVYDSICNSFKEASNDDFDLETLS